MPTYIYKNVHVYLRGRGLIHAYIYIYKNVHVYMRGRGLCTYIRMCVQCVYTYVQHGVGTSEKLVFFLESFGSNKFSVTVNVTVILTVTVTVTVTVRRSQLK